MHTKFFGEPHGQWLFGYSKRRWRMILRCILGKQVAKMEGGWNCLRMVSDDVVWH